MRRERWRHWNFLHSVLGQVRCQTPTTEHGHSLCFMGGAYSSRLECKVFLQCEAEELRSPPFLTMKFHLSEIAEYFHAPRTAHCFQYPSNSNRFVLCI